MKTVARVFKVYDKRIIVKKTKSRFKFKVKKEE